MKTQQEEATIITGTVVEEALQPETAASTRAASTKWGAGENYTNHATRNQFAGGSYTPGSSSFYQGETAAGAALGVRLFLALLVLVGVIAVPTILFSDSSYGTVPTPFPTVFPTVTAELVCPTVFDANRENSVLTDCSSAGCNGGIKWCGLDNARTYQLVITVRGDYDLMNEFLIFSFLKY